MNMNEELKMPSNGGRNSFILRPKLYMERSIICEIKLETDAWDENFDNTIRKISSSVFDVSVDIGLLSNLHSCLSGWTECTQTIVMPLTTEENYESLTLKISADSELLSNMQKPALFVDYRGLSTQLSTCYLIDQTCIKIFCDHLERCIKI